MKKNITIIIFLLLIVGALSGCGHEHTWIEATCTKPKTCTECGETEGDALEHVWIEATCTDPKTCSVCGETEGNALGHVWTEATCTDPKTCSVCGETEGNALGHTWIAANYQVPETCAVCGETNGSPLTADLETYNAVAYTAGDGTYDFITSSSVDTSAKVTGTLYISGYQVFEGDATYEAKAGYEWRTVHITVALTSDAKIGACVSDYYVSGRIDGHGKWDSTHGWTTYFVDYYGVKYDECAVITNAIWEPWFNEYEIDVYFRVPIGYDGALVSIYDSALAGSPLFQVLSDENTVNIRLK